MSTRSLFADRVAFGALFAAALLAPRPAASLEPPDLVEGFFELYVQGVPDRPTIIALIEEDGRVLLPLAPILRLTGIPVHDSDEGLVLEWPPESWRTELDPERRAFVTGNDTVRVGWESWIEQDGETFLATDAMERLLAATIAVDMRQLTVTVGGAPFPRVRRVEDEARRRRDQVRAQLFDPNRYAGVPYPSRTGGLAAGWSVSLSQVDGQSRGSVRPSLGVGILGGGAEAAVTGVFQETFGSEVNDVHLRYQRVLPEHPWVRQVEVGTIFSRGIVARSMVGALVTNEPYVIPRFFDETAITPAVPAGWEYEVYQGQHLVGISSAEDPTAIRAPLNYGSTPITVRMTGPAGQERVQELVYLVPHTQIPRGAWRYSAGGGACRGLGCDGYGYAEVGYGLSERFTIYAGGDWVGETGRSILRPSARIGFAPVAPLSLTAQALGADLLRGDVHLNRGRKGSMRATYTWVEPSPRPLGPPGWTGQASVSAPVPWLGGRWLYGRVYLRGLQANRLDAWQGAVSTNMGLTSIELGAESGLQFGALVTGRGQRTFVRNLPWSLRDGSIGGGLGVGGRGVELVEVMGSIRTRNLVNIDLRFRARRGFDPVLTLGVTLRTGLGLFRGSGSTGAYDGLYLAADGGVAYAPGVGALPLALQSVGRSGVRGDVFYDMDGDGQRDEDEPAVEEATVLVGGLRAPTDASGHFRTWELLPYEGTSVVIDSLSVDPDWVAAIPEIRLRPSPNLFTPVSVPLLRTREVMGSVLTGTDTPQPLAGAGVEIVDLQTGEVVISERTYSDGVFYAQRLRPGLYTVRLLESTATALGLETSPQVAFEVPPEAGPAVELSPIVVPPAN